MGVRCAVLFAVLKYANLSALAFAQPPCPGLHVRVLNLRNGTGTVAYALFESPEGFPDEYLHPATTIMIINTSKSHARRDFEDIPPGKNAMAAVHDENMTGKLDTNWIGIPKEDYGFSDNGKALLSAPSFSAGSSRYDWQNIDLTMCLRY